MVLGRDSPSGFDNPFQLHSVLRELLADMEGVSSEFMTRLDYRI